MIHEIEIPPTRTGDRNQCSESSASINVPSSTVFMGLFAFTCVASIAISVLAYGKAELAEERARLAEREARIMDADLQYVRAWASARGVYLPANHEEAESNEPSHHHQRPNDKPAAGTANR